MLSSEHGVPDYLLTRKTEVLREENGWQQGDGQINLKYIFFVVTVVNNKYLF
jgi:hypothetical protein